MRAAEHIAYNAPKDISLSAADEESLRKRTAEMLLKINTLIEHELKNYRSKEHTGIAHHKTEER